MIHFKESSRVTRYSSTEGIDIVDDNGTVTLRQFDAGKERTYHQNGGWFRAGAASKEMEFKDINYAFGFINNLMVDEHKVGDYIKTIHGDAVLVINDKYTELVPYKVRFDKDDSVGFLKLDELL